MAYLPPAGVRVGTSHKKTDWVFGREVPNIFHYNRDWDKVYYNNNDDYKVTVKDLPPTSVKAEDWEIPHTYTQQTSLARSSYRQDNNQTCSAVDPFQFMTDYSKFDFIAQNVEDVRDKYKVTHQVRITKDARGHWNDEYMRNAGIDGKWMDRYGIKYLYRPRDWTRKSRV